MTKASSHLPDDIAAALTKAEALIAGREFDAALNVLAPIVENDETNVNALFLLGFVAQQIDSLDSAIDAYQRVLACDPNYRDGFYRLVSVLARNGQGDIAYATLKAALGERGQEPVYWLSMGNVMLHMTYVNEAVRAYHKALELNPVSVAARLNLSEAELRRGQVDTALALAREVVTAAPELAAGHYNLAQILIARGEFDEGWAAFEYRFDIYGEGPEKGVERRNLPHQRWQGEALNGAGLVVWCEQGIGDEVYYASLFTALEQLDGPVAVECAPRMRPLLARSFPHFAIYEKSEPAATELLQAPWQRQIPAASLMAVLRPDLNPQVLTKTAFLVPDADLVADIRQRYQAQRSGPIIGISWRSGNITARQRRSIPLADWQAIIGNDRLNVISLQFGNHDREIIRAGRQFAHHLHLDPAIDAAVNLDDFAAQVAACDLVISVANSTVHIAGAVGVPVWVCLDSAPDCRWGLMRDRDDHYPSARLYRQTVPGDWLPVLDRLTADLAQFLDRYRA